MYIRLMLLIILLGSCKQVKTQYTNQEWVELSDSFGELKIIQPQLEAKLGVKVTTNAVSGSCIANGFDDAEGDGKHRLSFIERLPKIIEGKPSIILVVTGGNDWNYSVPIGISTDMSKNTYYGALIYLARQVRKNNLKMIWITMIQRNTVKHGGKLLGNINYNNQKNYCDAMCDIGSKYGIKVINAFSYSGITYQNSKIYTSDGAHPITEAGQSKYANFIINELLK